VLYVKKNGEKTFVITDGAMNDLIRPALYQAFHEIVPVAPRRSSRRAPADVVGPVCETGDFFARDRNCLRCSRVNWWRSSMPARTECRSPRTTTRALALRSAGRREACRLIRRRETIEDMLAQERAEALL